MAKTSIFATQGGGEVIWDGERFVFIIPPPKFPQYKRGDPMPEKWGIAGPINRN